MITNICLRLMHPGVLFLLSVLMLLLLKPATANSLGHQSVAGNGTKNIKCIDKERRALLDFKALILEDHYGLLSTWTAEEDECCKWSGVTCNNQTGHVTKLDLSNIYGKALQGEISPSLLNITYLSHLDLSDNAFNGSIPSFIGSLSHLRYLHLGYNNFDGTIPESIGSLAKLRYLYLGHNSLSGTLPRSIGSLTKLRYLSLFSNSINGTIPSSIGSMTELRYLSISLSNFGMTIPPEFGNLVNLQTLSLDTISMFKLGTGTIDNLDWLSRLSNLQSLQMSGISLAKANHWVNAMLSLQKLSSLSLYACNLSQVMHPYSSSFVNSSSSSIVSLDLGNNNLNSSIYHWLLWLTSNKLRTLDLTGNKLDGIPKYLGNLCSLTTLKLSQNSMNIKFSDLLYNLTGCTLVTLQRLDAERIQLIGSISDDIQKFSSLTELYLSHNRLNGSISDKMWELPMLKELYVSSNSIKGAAIIQNTGKSKLSVINLSNNSLEVIYMSNFSDAQDIDLSYCKLGPRFPKWIQTMKSLTSIDISNTKISDTIPVEFWNAWPSVLSFLNLSSNNISGQVPDLTSNFDIYSTIDLSFNNFSGPIQNVSSTLETLNLSKNKFYGGISFLCQIVEGFLAFLDLSDNSFTGKIPDCLWNFKGLTVLNLGNNNLSGRIPASVESLIALEVLYLYNNRFSGKLPLSLRNCSKLTFLDLGANRFSGSVPSWIGENLSGLYVLSLSSNNFFGNIPTQICQLVNLQILDLSVNNLNGTIPSCLDKLTSMVHGVTPNQTEHYFAYGSQSMGGGIYSQYGLYDDHAMIKWQGYVREFSSSLGFLNSIDLSDNNLTGIIPYQVTNLFELLALNLSRNALSGEIPTKIGEMVNLLTLDISGNSFSGSIPSSMSQMTSLNYLDVSYNNLSGRIPKSTQLQSFQPSRYTGNKGLCGPPVTKHCRGDKELQVPPTIDESKGDGQGKDEFWRWFFIGGGTGFATGFWITCSALLLNRRVRHALFLFLDNLKDWIYVKVMLFIARLQRVAYE